MKTVASAASAVLLCVAASGCLTVADNQGAVLSIELFWDAKPTSSSFIGGTCRSAGVENMQWRLIRTDGDKDEVVAERDEPCHNGIDVIDPDRGEYKLEITGFDQDDAPLWSVECSGLTVLRFDVAYECDIEAP